jgi:hypothetical protein
MEMNESNVVALHKKVRAPTKSGDQQLADDVRKLYRKLCTAIDKATGAGLDVKVYLDSSDTYGANKVRTRNVEITKKI